MVMMPVMMMTMTTIDHVPCASPDEVVHDHVGVVPQAVGGQEQLAPTLLVHAQHRHKVGVLGVETGGGRGLGLKAAKRSSMGEEELQNDVGCGRAQLGFGRRGGKVGRQATGGGQWGRQVFGEWGGVGKASNLRQQKDSKSESGAASMLRAQAREEERWQSDEGNVLRVHRYSKSESGAADSGLSHSVRKDRQREH